MGEWRKTSYEAIERAIRASKKILIEERAGLYADCCLHSKRTGEPRLKTMTAAAKPRVLRLTRAINQCDRALFFIKRDEGGAA